MNTFEALSVHTLFLGSVQPQHMVSHVFLYAVAHFNFPNIFDDKVGQQDVPQYMFSTTCSCVDRGVALELWRQGF